MMLLDCIEGKIQTTGKFTPLLSACIAGEEFSPVTNSQHCDCILQLEKSIYYHTWKGCKKIVLKM